MEDKIEERLFEEYTNVGINVKFMDFNVYNIKLIILNKKINFIYKFDKHFTFNENMKEIIKIIDKIILSNYKL